MLPGPGPRLDMLPLEEEDYRQAILDQLDPLSVYEDLGPEAVLLCREPPGVFCHRCLVAAWLEEHLGVEGPELPLNYHPNQKDLF
jgi:hypothetical protein